MREQSLVNQRTFGRRASGGPSPRSPVSDSGPVAGGAGDGADEIIAARAAQITWSSVKAEAPSIDEELRTWKEARKRKRRIPWRQISFTASACFGIGSFALPESTNDSVQWVLYALMAASFCAGFAERRTPK
jgi:hypothetical protein